MKKTESATTFYIIFLGTMDTGESIWLAPVDLGDAIFTKDHTEAEKYRDRAVAERIALSYKNSYIQKFSIITTISTTPPSAA